MSSQDNSRRPWFKRYGLVCVIGVAAIGLFFLVRKLMNEKPAPRRESSFTMVNLPPPPPPPPPAPTPPPVQQEPQEQKMIEQAPLTEEDTKLEPAEAPKDEPPELGTNIKGDGPADGFGLSGRGNGMIGGGGRSGANRSQWGWYAAEVQSSISDALRKNKKTRSSSLRVTVRIWADSTGRVTRAALNESTGDTALDDAITNDVLTGLQLKSALPQGMPSPIVLRISGRRPK